jgi:hypothetical protein
MDLASGAANGVPTSRKYSQVESDESDHRALFQNPACGLTQFKLRIILILSAVHSSLTNPRIYNLCCEVPLILRPTCCFLSFWSHRYAATFPPKCSHTLDQGCASHLSCCREECAPPYNPPIGRRGTKGYRPRKRICLGGTQCKFWGYRSRHGTMVGPLVAGVFMHNNSILFISLGRMAWAGDQVGSAM